MVRADRCCIRAATRIISTKKKRISHATLFLVGLAVRGEHRFRLRRHCQYDATQSARHGTSGLSMFRVRRRRLHLRNLQVRKLRLRTGSVAEGVTQLLRRQTGPGCAPSGKNVAGGHMRLRRRWLRLHV